jgi:hypothetical protein
MREDIFLALDHEAFELKLFFIFSLYILNLYPQQLF